MFGPILLITTMLAAVSMAAPADPDFALESVPVRSGDVGKSNSLEKRSYAASCRSCAVGSEGSFLCSCRRVDGGYGASSIELNECLGNGDGWLTWQRNGNFADSCYDFRYDGVTTRFHVSCRTRDGYWIPSSVVLDERLHNDNGRLWCGV